MAGNRPEVAVVGCGKWGANHVRVWYELGCLRTLCDIDDVRLQALAARYPGVRVTNRLDEVLEDEAVTGVILATPAQTHADLGRFCLQADKDVLIEKPLALTVRDAQEIVDLAAARRRILMVGHVLEYHPAVTRLRDLIRQGELGRIQYLYAHRLNLGRIRTAENALWSFAPHDIALILRFLDMMPEEVLCQGEAYLHEHVADVTLMGLKFPGKVQAHIFVSWLHPFKEHRFIVVGDRQMAVFDDTLPWERKLVLYPHRVQWMQGRIPVAHKAEAHPVELEEAEPLRVECERFLSCMIRRDPPLTDGASALRVIWVLQAAQKSLDSASRPVSLEADETRDRPWWAHPTAVIDPGAVLGEGTRVWHYTHVMPGARIGRGCILGQNVFVGRDVVIGDRVKIQNNVSVYTGVTLEDEVFCGPSMVFTNVINPRSGIERKHEFRPTLVRRGASLGANSTILCGVTIGRYAMVGAGAVVTRDVPDYAVVTGVPARRTGWVCACGVTLPQPTPDATCGDCGQTYRLEPPDRLIPIERSA